MACILLTGGFGFIGSAVVRHLLATTDAMIVNIDKMTYAASPAALAMHAADPRHIHIRADICDAEAMRAAFRDHRPDRVMHLAAESHVDRSIDGPAEFIRTNVVGTQVLLEAAREYWMALGAEAKATFRFHHVSTDEVFGSLYPGDPPFTPETPYDPRSPYSASKAASGNLTFTGSWNASFTLATGDKTEECRLPSQNVTCMPTFLRTQSGGCVCPAGMLHDRINGRCVPACPELNILRGNSTVSGMSNSVITATLTASSSATIASWSTTATPLLGSAITSPVAV
jgi:hypothetical protein